MRFARVFRPISLLCLFVFTIGINLALANNAPVITCPVPVDPAILCNYQVIDGNDGIFNLGDLVTGSAIASDPDSDPLTWSIIAVTRDGQPAVPSDAPTIDTDGKFSWQSAGTDAEGIWEFCIEVSDGELADTCCFDVDLELKFYLSLRDVTGTVDTIPSAPGRDIDIYLNLSPAVPLSSLSTQFTFDQEAMLFRGPAMPIGNLTDWEYFTYRMSFDTTCAGTGPLGLMSILAIADLDNGAATVPPDGAYGLDGNIVRFRFSISQDWNYLGHCLPLTLCSVDCNDNRLVSRDAAVEYLPIGADPGCFTGSTVENIQTCEGRVCIRDPDPAACDVNLNGIGPEVGDVVLFINWFLYGDEVLIDPWIPIQLQLTDCNNDGLYGTFADLVYMIKVISESWIPFPPDPGKSADIAISRSDDNVTVTSASASNLGGALLVFEYNGVDVGEPVLNQRIPGMTVESYAANGELRVLLMPSLTDGNATIAFGSNDLLNIPIDGGGTFELKRVELSDGAGEVVDGRILDAAAHPASYALWQNYPNPFNAGTVIPFDLQDASDWELTIYNIVGQEVRTFKGVSGASRVEIQWDGRNESGQPVASGMYFYRMRAGNFVASRKMTLLK